MKNILISFFILCSSVYTMNAQLICKEAVNLSLSFEGTGDLRPIDLLDSPINPAHSYTLSESFFNCADVDHSYTLIVEERSGTTLINSCWSIVTVEDKFDNGPCDIVRAWCITETIPFRLGSDGELTVTPDMVTGGPVSQAYDYTVTPSYFDCADVGTQTVTLVATGANGTTASCTSEMMIANPLFPSWTCFRLLLSDLRFFPSGIFANVINPGIIVPFYVEFEKSLDIKKSLSTTFTMVLSKDKEISKDDQILMNQNIQFKPKEFTKSINSKFQVPQNTQVGEYYLLADMTTSNKKEKIGFEKYILPVIVGYSENGSNATGNRNKSTSTDIKIYPNPFDQQLQITQLSSNTTSKIDIVDMTGKLWISTQVQSESISMNTSMLPSGVYIAKVTSIDQETQIFKLIKTN